MDWSFLLAAHFTTDNIMCRLLWHFPVEKWCWGGNACLPPLRGACTIICSCVYEGLFQLWRNVSSIQQYCCRLSPCACPGERDVSHPVFLWSSAAFVNVNSNKTVASRCASSLRKDSVRNRLKSAAFCTCMRNFLILNCRKASEH